MRIASSSVSTTALASNRACCQPGFGKSSADGREATARRQAPIIVVVGRSLDSERMARHDSLVGREDAEGALVRRTTTPAERRLREYA